MGSQIENLSWNTDMESGIDILDAQHHKYFDLLNDFLQKASASSSAPDQYSELAKTFDFLRQYAVEHFTTEQAIMEEAGYPDSELHEKEHLYFLKHVGELYQRLKTNGYSPDLAREVNYYTIEWFIEHIRLTDMKLVKFLKAESVEDKKLPGFLSKIYDSLFTKQGGNAP